MSGEEIRQARAETARLEEAVIKLIAGIKAAVRGAAVETEVLAVIVEFQSEPPGRMILPSTFDPRPSTSHE